MSSECQHLRVPVISAFSTLGTREDSVTSASGILGTREDAVISATGTLGGSPGGLARTQSFQPVVLMGLLIDRSFVGEGILPVIIVIITAAIYIVVTAGPPGAAGAGAGAGAGDGAGA